MFCVTVACHIILVLSLTSQLTIVCQYFFPNRMTGRELCTFPVCFRVSTWDQATSNHTTRVPPFIAIGESDYTRNITEQIKRVFGRWLPLYTKRVTES